MQVLSVESTSACPLTKKHTQSHSSTSFSVLPALCNSTSSFHPHPDTAHTSLGSTRAREVSTQPLHCVAPTWTNLGHFCRPRPNPREASLRVSVELRERVLQRDLVSKILRTSLCCTSEGWGCLLCLANCASAQVRCRKRFLSTPRGQFS